MKQVFASYFRMEMKRWLKVARDFRGIILIPKSKNGERYFVVPIDKIKHDGEIWL